MITLAIEGVVVCGYTIEYLEVIGRTRKELNLYQDYLDTFSIRDVYDGKKIRSLGEFVAAKKKVCDKCKVHKKTKKR